MLGCIQGRLTKFKNNKLQVFPKNKWIKEFQIASKVNIDFIEFFVEREGDFAHNPFFNSKKFTELKKNSKKYLKKNHSFCDDYYINHSIINIRNFKRIENLFIKMNQIKIKVYVLPLLEKSNITSSNYLKFIHSLKKISNIAKKYKIFVALECNLSMKKLSNLIKRVDNSSLKVVYDTGNRCLVDKNQEHAINYLAKHIIHVHIKDKNKKGDNVYLGTGIVNFVSIFKALKKINYKANYVFETLRGKNPILTMKYNIFFVNFFLKEFDL